MDSIAPSHTYGSSEARERLDWRGILYLVPFFACLIASSFLFRKQLMLGTMEAQQVDMVRTSLFAFIYLTAFLLLLCRLRDTFLLLMRNWLYVAFLGYVILSSQWSAHPLKVFMVWGHFAGGFLVCLAAMLALQGQERAVYKLFALFAAAAVFVTLATVIFSPSRGITDVGGKLRWVGLTQNANFLGMVLLVSFWGCVAHWFAARRLLSRMACLFLLFLVALCLYGSNSMTSVVLCAFVGISIPLLYWLRRVRALVLVSAGMILVTTLAALLSTWYLSSPQTFTAENLASAVGRDVTLTGRTGLWKDALPAIAKRPLNGWSFDNLMTVREFHNRPLRAPHYHNGYLDLLVRGGFVALGFLLVFIGQILVGLISAHRSRPLLFAGMLPLLTALLIHNVTETSFGISPHILWLVFTFMLLYLHGRHWRAPAPRPTEGVTQAFTG